MLSDTLSWAAMPDLSSSSLRLAGGEVVWICFRHLLWWGPVELGPGDHGPENRLRGQPPSSEFLICRIPAQLSPKKRSPNVGSYIE